MSIQDKLARRVKSMDERSGVPMCIYWDTATIADWIVCIGYPQYRECITKNFITGRHLICLDSSRLPDMGITDFEHIKDITSQIRDLLELNHIIKNMNVSMSDPMIAYMEMKRRSGRTSQNTSFVTFLNQHRRWYK